MDSVRMCSCVRKRALQCLGNLVYQKGCADIARFRNSSNSCDPWSRDNEFGISSRTCYCNTDFCHRATNGSGKFSQELSFHKATRLFQP